MRLPDGRRLYTAPCGIRAKWPSGRCIPLYIIMPTQLWGPREIWEEIWGHSSLGNITWKKIQPGNTIIKLKTEINLETSLLTWKPYYLLTWRQLIWKQYFFRKKSGSKSTVKFSSKKRCCQVPNEVSNFELKVMWPS